MKNRIIESVKALLHSSRNLKLLAFTVFCVMFGFGSFTAAYTNFVVEILNIRPEQMGIVESIRELPGFLIIIVMALTMRISEPVLASAGLFLLAAGIGAIHFVNDITLLIILSFSWGLGMHTWLTVYPSMTLSLAKEGAQGRRMGQMASIGSLGMICGMLLVFVLGKTIGFRNVFSVSGITAAVAACSALMISRDVGHHEKPRFVWKRKYSLYYVLTLLEGCRRQIFTTFAVFALVRKFETTVSGIALLMVVNSLVNTGFAHYIGKVIDRIGEKRVLVICYSLIIPVFIGYALIKQVHVLYLLYILDNILFLGSMSLTTYLQKISEPRDLMPSLAMGVSMNHAAAITVPVIGGFLWASVGYPVTFIGGAAIAALSVLMSMRIKTSREDSMFFVKVRD